MPDNEAPGLHTKPAIAWGAIVVPSSGAMASLTGDKTAGSVVFLACLLAGVLAYATYVTTTGTKRRLLAAATVLGLAVATGTVVYEAIPSKDEGIRSTPNATSSVTVGADSPADPAIELGARLRGVQRTDFSGKVVLTDEYGTIDVRAIYSNSAAFQAEKVKMNIYYPSQLQVDTDALGILNASSPGSAFIDPLEVKKSLQGLSLNIGSYTPGSNAIIIFPIDIVDALQLPCGLSRFSVRVSFTAERTNEAKSSNSASLEFHRNGIECDR